MLSTNRLKGIILIIVDALRHDSLIELIKLGKANTLRRLMSRGINFNTCFSLTNTTDPSVTTIMSGLHPLNHGVINHGEKVTASELRRARYLTFLSDILTNKGWFNIGLDILERWHTKGFDIYLSTTRGNIRAKYSWLLSNLKYGHLKLFLRNIGLRLQITKHIWEPIFSYYQDAHILVDMAIRYIRLAIKKKRNFIVLLHFWSTHIPYYANTYKNFGPLCYKKYKNICDKDFRNVLLHTAHVKRRRYLNKWGKFRKYKKIFNVISDYYSSIIHVDDAIHKLLDSLCFEGILDETLIVLTADHGESLVEHEIFFDHHGLYDVSIRVPLIFYSGSINRASTNNTALHVDILPTLLEMLDIHTEFQFDGINLNKVLNDEVPDRPVVSIETYTEKKIGIRWNGYKYIRSLNLKNAICRYCGKIHGGLRELYDLNADPNETKNIIRENGEIEQKFIEKFKREIIKFRVKTALKS